MEGLNAFVYIGFVKTMIYRKSMLVCGLALSWVLAKAQPEYYETWQLALISMENGDTLHLPEGRFQLSQSLLMDGLENVVIMGQGREKTILSFQGQEDGAEGLKITNCKNITLAHFGVFDTAGDAIKTQHCDGIRFVGIETSWTGKPKSSNGAYGLYPVQCSRVLIEECKARGASDAGIYVGQSDQVIVRRSEAYENVAGIEIENTTRASVYDNIAKGNTGGILVFDLPGLIKKSGGQVWVYNNEVLDNNLDNFAPKGNIVAQVPAGTGVMVLATSDVHIEDNQILNHKTSPVAVVSYYITELPIEDAAYNPFPKAISIMNNRIERRKQWPSLKSKVGKLLAWKYGRDVPVILYDGISPEAIAGKPDEPGSEGICIKGQQGDLGVLDAARKFKNLSRNPPGYVCTFDSKPSWTADLAKEEISLNK